ncbi:MAG: hypothetical protein AAFX52_11925 [Pseudomonadota bacterium]
MNLKQHSQASQSTFMGSVKWLANMLAVIITFFLTPKAYSLTESFVIDYTSDHYGYGFEDITSFVWGIYLALTIFFFSRATVSTSLVMGGLALASRMF